MSFSWQYDHWYDDESVGRFGIFRNIYLSAQARECLHWPVWTLKIVLSQKMSETPMEQIVHPKCHMAKLNPKQYRKRTLRNCPHNHKNGQRSQLKATNWSRRRNQKKQGHKDSAFKTRVIARPNIGPQLQHRYDHRWLLRLLFHVWWMSHHNQSFHKSSRPFNGRWKEIAKVT